MVWCNGTKSSWLQSTLCTCFVTSTSASLVDKGFRLMMLILFDDLIECLKHFPIIYRLYLRQKWGFELLYLLIQMEWCRCFETAWKHSTFETGNVVWWYLLILLEFMSRKCAVFNELLCHLLVVELFCVFATWQRYWGLVFSNNYQVKSC